MTDLFDVIIIGAGPSGSSCAYNIKRYNPEIKILLVDKAEFPRYKPCGGGVSPEVANYFDFDLTPAIDYKCRHVEMVANGKHWISDQFELWMVRRDKFDNFLLEKAREKGVEFISGCEVVNIVTGSTETLLKTKRHGDLHAKLVVIAEGGLGKLAKKLGCAPKNNVLAALEYEHYTDQLDGKLFIDFDYNCNGYAWNFPKSDGLSLGIGGFFKGQNKGPAGLPQKLLEYSQQFGIAELDKSNLHGHPIQLYKGRQQLVAGNVLLVGEIAGCVDPLTAEGIRPAIKSGYLAAKVIADSFKMGKLKLNNLRRYDVEFHNQLGKDFQYARIMAYFLNKYLAKILPMISSHQAVAGFMSVFSGKSTYRKKINFRRIIKMIWRAVF